MKPAWLLAACAAMALWSGVAAADAVPEPPTDCPDGTTPNTCHGGPYCAPTSCTQDADCADGKVCRERSLCLGSISCGGGWDPDATPDSSPQILGECGPDASCDPSAPCTPMKVCVSPGGASSSGSGDGSGDDEDLTVTGCSCRAAGAGNGLAVGAVAAGVLVAGAAVFVSRRSRDQRSRQRRR